MDSSFDVRFETSRRSSMGAYRAANPFSFAGPGKVSLAGDSIRFQGRRRRLFQWDPEQEHGLPLSAVCNVISQGRYVEFEVRADDGNLHEVRCSLVSPAKAEELAALLPNVQTEAFAREQSEWEDFRERMFAFQPDAPMTQGLVAANVLLFLLMLFNGAGLFSVSGETALSWGANQGVLTLGGQWWRLFSSMFIHFGLLHIGMNMLSLWVIGGLTEQLFGSPRFLAVYLLGGIGGSLVSVWWHPNKISAGASGAIFAMFGGLLAFLAKDGNAMPATVSRKMQRDMGAMLVLNLLVGLHAGIDNAAHIGGLVAGFIVGAILARPLPYLSR